MGWRLADQVSFCIIARDVIFLDVAQDRYFQLGARHGDAFIAWCREASPPAESLVTLLVDRGLIVSSDGPDRLVAATAPSATCERPPSPRSLLQSLLEAPMVFASFRRARLALRRQGLAKVLGDLGSGTEDSAILAGGFCETARRLAQDNNCLIRSLALRHYLDRRHASATLVFGVTARPFKAHCWLQDGDLVLNDELDAVAPFTAILTR